MTVFNERMFYYLLFTLNYLHGVHPDDGPCETETRSSEVRLIININLEVFVVVMVILSLLLYIEY
jgi:hypothetical protein